MIKTEYDVVIVGGGIHGVGVAQASVAEGYSVLLLEQNEIASGTSQKSSKLIHGGLRYLETAQFSLVHECLQERQFLLQNAPHLVEMKRFYLPIYKQTSRRPLQIRLGLSLYSLLAGFKKNSFFNSIKSSNWHDLDGLTTENLQHVYQYWDAQTDDKKLTQAVLRSAEKMGAQTAKNTIFQSAMHEGEGWNIQLEMQNQQISTNAKVLINAGGAWINDVLQRISPQEPQLSVELVQGSHIILDQKLIQGIYYLESPLDRRAIFVMPWYGQTLIGTTERIYNGNPADVRPNPDELEYLLSTAKTYFPRLRQSSLTDIVDSFAGLRVLPQQQGTAFSRPRETSIHVDQTGCCFSIVGGKLTAYRATAQTVLEMAKKILPNTSKIADTRYLALPEVFQ